MVGLNWLLILNGHLYLSGLWLNVDVRAYSEKEKCLEEIGLCVPNLLPILGSMIKIIKEMRKRTPTKKRNLTVPMNRIFTQAPKIMRKMVVGTIGICQSSHTTCVFNPTRSGWELESACLRPAYLEVFGLKIVKLSFE